MGSILYEYLSFVASIRRLKNENQFCGDLLRVLSPDGAAELNSVFADVTTIIVACLHGVGEENTKARLLLV